MGYDKNKRPFLVHNLRISNTRTSTASSTALEVGGVVSFESTSTGAANDYTLARLLDRGEQMGLHVATIGSSSAGGGQFHVNMASGQTVGTSSEDRLTLDHSGDGALLVGISSERVAALGANSIVFSTST